MKKEYKKFIGCAYASSPTAEKHGFATTGCWYFALRTDFPCDEKIKLCSISKDEVIDHSYLYDGKWDQYSQYIPPMKMESPPIERTMENMPPDMKARLREVAGTNTRAAIVLQWLENIPLRVALKRINEFRQKQRDEEVWRQAEEEIAHQRQQQALEADRKQREVQEIWDGFSSAKTIEDIRPIICAILTKLWGPKP